MRYIVIDLQTQIVMGTRNTRAGAQTLANRLDAEYGAVRYAVRREVLGASETPAHKGTVLA